MKYRKRPLVISAVRVLPENRNALAVLIGEQNVENALRTIYHGDWIVKGIEGEVYPVANSVFEKTYEPVEG